MSNKSKNNVSSSHLNKHTQKVIETLSSNANPAEKTILDIERLQLIFGANDLLLQDFLHTFLDETQQLLTEMSTGIEHKDAKKCAEKCHQLKGICGNTGATQLYNMAIQQEQIILKESWLDVATLQQQMLHGLEKLYSIVEALVKK